MIKLSNGVVHDVSDDIATRLNKESVLVEKWESLTPLARNEWLCWIYSAKKQETRRKRIERLASDLLTGKRRPCCWPGCSHREKI